MGQKILVTGGAGYIGSHTTLELLDAGYDVVIVDNLSNASRESLARVAALTGREPEFHEVDIRDADGLDTVFGAHAFANTASTWPSPFMSLRATPPLSSASLLTG